MKKQSIYLISFTILFAFFFLGLVLFRTPFQLYPLMSIQDVLDLLTPLVLLPLYWLLIFGSLKNQAKPIEIIAFLLLAGLWVLGQGMHLAANSINNLAGKLEKQNIIAIQHTALNELIYFLDEILSHYIWHIAILSFVLFLVVKEWRAPEPQKIHWVIIVLCALVHGFTLFCVFLEGGTTFIAFPFSLLFSIVFPLIGFKRLKKGSLITFLYATFLFTAVFFAIWGWIYVGFPQFSEVGLI